MPPDTGHTAYRFASLWRLHSRAERVYGALAEVEHYDLWWPQVLSVRRIDDRTGEVRARSVLPYTLDLVLSRCVEDPSGGHLRVGVGGDLNGFCAWQVLATSDDTTVARFTQEVEVQSPLLRRLSRLGRPVLVANHRHMMRSGERGLRAHLAADSD